MSNTYVRGHEHIHYDFAHTSAVVSGQVVPIVTGLTGKIGIAIDAAAANVKTGYYASDVHVLPCLSSDTGVAGTIVYWDAGNSRITTTSTSNTRAGCLAGPKLNGETTAQVHVNAI